jgi:tRNA pseudouridine13 synthase
MTSEKGISGKIREKPEYFKVEEIPVYLPSGEGKHLYVNFTKKGMTTKEAEKKIAELLNIGMQDIGSAGLKDKNAVTTQTISINTEKIKKTAEEIAEEVKKVVDVNWFKFHSNKLKPGHLLGNKFEIIISDLDEKEKAFEQAEKIAEKLRGTGIPNYYGEQRFGFGENAEKGFDIIKGRRERDKWLRNFLVSSFQSYLCNLYLARRVELGFKLIKGDICKKHDTGGLFVAENLDEEQKRYDRKEISFTAPMFGRDLWFAEDEAGKIEKEILANSGVSLEEIGKLCNGTRRLGRILLSDLKLEKAEEGIKLSFSLPKGAFATVVLREFLKSD